MNTTHRICHRRRRGLRLSIAAGLSGSVFLLSPWAAPHALGSIEKLESMPISMMSVVLDAFAKEGTEFNQDNVKGALPLFHSAQWNPSTRNLNWRFLVPPEGELFENLRTLSRPQAIARLKQYMEDLAVLIGLQPMPGLRTPIGMLDIGKVPGRDRLSEEDWQVARTELAGASVIHLAAPHKDGSIYLIRQANGRVIETRGPQPAAKPTVRNPRT